jgi:hypothetical protein
MPSANVALIAPCNDRKPKLTIDIDNLLDGLSKAAFSSELLAKDRAADTPKIEFSANKILAKRFFDNLNV